MLKSGVPIAGPTLEWAPASPDKSTETLDSYHRFLQDLSPRRRPLTGRHAARKLLRAMNSKIALQTLGSGQ